VGLFVASELAVGLATLFAPILVSAGFLEAPRAVLPVSIFTFLAFCLRNDYLAAFLCGNAKGSACLLCCADL
jgi:hypothetical protein